MTDTLVFTRDPLVVGQLIARLLFFSETELLQNITDTLVFTRAPLVVGQLIARLLFFSETELLQNIYASPLSGFVCI